jgi:hypothetical protein
MARLKQALENLRFASGHGFTRAARPAFAKPLQPLGDVPGQSHRRNFD